MRETLFVGLLSAIAFAHSAGAAPLEMTCEADQTPIEPCFRIHARLYTTNGIPVRLWPVGTKRHLAVRNLDSLHPLIARYLDSDSNLYGDFEACPLTEDRPGHMRSVCLRSAENLVVERGSGDQREVFRLLPTWPTGGADPDPLRSCPSGGTEPNTMPGQPCTEDQHMAQRGEVSISLEQCT